MSILLCTLSTLLAGARSCTSNKRPQRTSLYLHSAMLALTFIIGRRVQPTLFLVEFGVDLVLVLIVYICVPRECSSKIPQAPRHGRTATRAPPVNCLTAPGIKIHAPIEKGWLEYNIEEL